jgi:hypothetical protein
MNTGPRQGLPTHGQPFGYLADWDDELLALELQTSRHRKVAAYPMH